MASKIAKAETDVPIKASAEQFHGVFSNRPYHVAKFTPEKIKSVEIREGEWGTEGSVVVWNYVQDGKPSVAKESVESIDRENNKVVFKVLEGDLLEHYKSFKLIIQVTPQPHGKGSVAHWILEYEKLKDDVPYPHSLLQLLIDVSKDTDAHLTAQ